MPIIKRGQRWLASAHYKGQRRRQSFDKYEDAEQWEMTAKWAMKHGKEITTRLSHCSTDATGPTMFGLMQDTLKYEWAGTRNERAAATNAEHCVSHLGADTLVSSVTSSQIHDMRLAWERDGKSTGTINRRLSALSKMFSHAIDRGLISSKPPIKRAKEPVGRIRWLSKEEERMLLTLLTGDAKEIAMVGIDTGMRMSELLNLEARDVSERAVSLWKTKTDVPRVIPCTRRAWDVLSLRASVTTGKLFAGWTVDKFDYRWNVARKAMGLAEDKDFVPHAMRHTFCSRLAQAGESPYAIMNLAGHRNLKTTERYVHMAPANMRSAIDALEA